MASEDSPNYKIAIAESFDGQQYVCDRLIIASLPWTHAEYEQLVRRIYRQKSSFVKMEKVSR